MNTKPFEHQLTSHIEDKQDDFPRRAFYGLFEFFNIKDCHHLLWKMLRCAMCTEDKYLEAEERLDILNYYESLKDVLDAAYMLHEAHAPYSMVQYDAQKKKS